MVAVVGQTPWSAAGPLAGFLVRRRKADEGVGGGPGGPPHKNLMLLQVTNL